MRDVFGPAEDALGDVRITVEVLFHLLDLLAARAVTRLDQVLDLQHHARDGRRFLCPLPRERVHQAPSQPGVYELYDAAGRLLYVGKATNLRERLLSYLSNAAGHSDKTLDLIRHIHDVRARPTGSALEAALEEAEAIRRLQPPYNRLGKHLPRIAFLKLTVRDDFPRLSVARSPRSRRARYIGPFRSREEADRVLDGHLEDFGDVPAAVADLEGEQAGIAAGPACSRRRHAVRRRGQNRCSNRARRGSRGHGWRGVG